MHYINAIMVTLSLLAAGVAATLFLDFPGTIPLILLSTIWATWDASRIGLSRYDTALRSPFTVLFGCLFFWVIVFPWYFVVRQKIMDGTATLKPA